MEFVVEEVESYNLFAVMGTQRSDDVKSLNGYFTVMPLFFSCPQKILPHGFQFFHEFWPDDNS